ncbi:Hypothetical predicted protein [Mytilus galloprovincialis]|uniref:PHR domain-containing protein n=1 Tax=Mytilus galloprovincialis TaxID=29158 RepID=A0A8B6FDA3_MYTGA|nr:Hypothetical predicted protein [Mytilus galloprovincialis]
MPLKILKEKEIICMFTTPFTDESSLFNTIPRTPVSERTLYRLERHRAIDSLRRNTDKIDALGIRVDKPIWLRGVIIYGGYGTRPDSDPPWYIFNSTSTISLLNSTGEICYEKNAPILERESCQTYDVRITNPIQLKANTPYTLLVKNINFISYFEKDCKTTSTSNGVTVPFRNSPMCMLDSYSAYSYIILIVTKIYAFRVPQEGSLPKKGEIIVPDIQENTFRVLQQ